MNLKVKTSKYSCLPKKHKILSLKKCQNKNVGNLRKSFVNKHLEKLKAKCIKIYLCFCDLYNSNSRLQFKKKTIRTISLHGILVRWVSLAFTFLCAISVKKIYDLLRFMSYKINKELKETSKYTLIILSPSHQLLNT